jgi:hypothetical protein
LGNGYSHQVHVVSDTNPLIVHCERSELTRISFVDPNVESDIYADKPWALSPMVASMNYLSVGSGKASSATTVTEEHVAEGESLPRCRIVEQGLIPRYPFGE